MDQVRIGVNTGHVLSGTFGSDKTLRCTSSTVYCRGFRVWGLGVQALGL